MKKKICSRLAKAQCTLEVISDYDFNCEIYRYRDLGKNSSLTLQLADKKVVFCGIDKVSVMEYWGIANSNHSIIITQWSAFLFRPLLEKEWEREEDWYSISNLKTSGVFLEIADKVGKSLALQQNEIVHDEEDDPLKEWFNTYESSSSREPQYSREELESFDDDSKKIEAVEFLLNDALRVYLSKDSSIYRFSERSNDVERVKVDSLKEGDHLILTDSKAREDLYEEILGELAGDTNFNKYLDENKKWKASLRKAFNLTKNKERLHCRFLSLGGEAHHSTFRMWILDDTYAPRSDKNLDALIRFLGLQDNFSRDEIRNTAERISTTNRTIGRLLSKAIMSKGIGFNNDIKNEMVEKLIEDTGISTDELSSLINLYQIVKVNNRDVKVSSYALKIFLKVDNKCSPFLMLVIFAHLW